MSDTVAFSSVYRKSNLDPVPDLQSTCIYMPRGWQIFSQPTRNHRVGSCHPQGFIDLDVLPTNTNSNHFTVHHLQPTNGYPATNLTTIGLDQRNSNNRSLHSLQERELIVPHAALTFHQCLHLQYR